MKKRLFLLFFCSLVFLLLLSLNISSEDSSENKALNLQLLIKNEVKLEKNDDGICDFKPLRVVIRDFLTFPEANMNKKIFERLFERLGSFIECEFQAFSLTGKSG